MPKRTKQKLKDSDLHGFILLNICVHRTIAINVIVTFITLSIAVCVFLVIVFNRGAVVTNVSKVVLVDIFLLYIWHVDTVILKGKAAGGMVPYLFTSPTPMKNKFVNLN